MKRNKLYIEKAEKIKQSLDGAFNIDIDKVYSLNTDFCNDAFYKVKDLILHFIHLVYSYGSSLPLNIQVGKLYDECPVVYEPARCENLKAKVEYYIGFFIEYLTEFDDAD